MDSRRKVGNNLIVQTHTYTMSTTYINTLYMNIHLHICVYTFMYDLCIFINTSMNVL